MLGDTRFCCQKLLLFAVFVHDLAAAAFWCNLAYHN